MPKLIDYPRTSYTGAWEVAEIVDDTGGKCALETSARKLNRKVSGSFKAIVGSAVKFGLLTSKREMLTTTTLFRRIKHAYDKQEELVFHREAFLTPPLFTQLCRKFRSRELPVAMLDVLLMREFDVEEINAQSVAKAFIDGARMVGLLNEDNIVADIDQLAAQQPPRREIASPTPSPNVFRQGPTPAVPHEDVDAEETDQRTPVATSQSEPLPPMPETTPQKAQSGAGTAGARAATLPAPRPAPAATTDAIANLFGMSTTEGARPAVREAAKEFNPPVEQIRFQPQAPASLPSPATTPPVSSASISSPSATVLFTIQLIGPGINTQLDVTDIDDLALVRALLDKIERRLKS